jgi:hypothetical protein
MSPSDRRPSGPELPAGVTVAFGTTGDVDLLRPFWLALHRIHQEADPELAPCASTSAGASARRGPSSPASPPVAE